MKKKDDIQRKEISSKNIADDELSSLKVQINDMQLEIGLLKETINVLKKDRGVDLTSLKNREKTAMIDAMKNKYPLSILLKRLALSKSSYYYQKSALHAKINILPSGNVSKSSLWTIDLVMVIAGFMLC